MRHERFLAHSPTDERPTGHALVDHLRATGDLASSFLGSAGILGFLGLVAGRGHDLGKRSREFMARLQGGKKVDHSTAGARVVFERYSHPIGVAAAHCIAGHHKGLANGEPSADGRIKPLEVCLDRSKYTTVPELVDGWERDVTFPDIPNLDGVPTPRRADNRTEREIWRGVSASFLIRRVFSALIDADRLDTARYYGRDVTAASDHPPIAVLLARLDAHMKMKRGTGYVNELRAQVLSSIRQHGGTAPQGLFSLTAPTGSGKTLASLVFALMHAKKHNLDRVIYVLPFTTIVEQTADEFREALAADRADPCEFIVEHHSNFDESEISRRESLEKLHLVMERWDAPVIVTTTVQLFESLYSNRPSRCRKLHNIANSVVVLDEVQSLPTHVLQPCVAAIDELARNWGTSLVLCTATQPALSESDGSSGFDRGLQDVRELAPEPESLRQALQRFTVLDRGSISDDDLASEIKSIAQVMCVVNTRRHALELYRNIADADGAVHLSTRMCARHRSAVIARIKRRLESDEPVRLVSTSLIEAGVDIDFPVVWRAEAGLESIIQTGGRCNREGRLDSGLFHIFESGEDYGSLPAVKQRVSCMELIKRRFGCVDMLGLPAIKAYYQELYAAQGECSLDKHGILGSLGDSSHNWMFDFENIAKNFRLIEDSMVPVVVRYRGMSGNDNTVDDILHQLNAAERGRVSAVARKLQPYAVSVPRRARDQLVESGVVRYIREKELGDQFAELVDGFVTSCGDDCYSDEIGLIWEDDIHIDPGHLTM